MDLELRGLHVLVTGGSRGIGLACGLGFLKEGARVSICGRDPAHLEAARARILDEFGQDAATLPADLRDPDAADRIVRDAIARNGPLDVLVNSAGAARRTPFAELDPAAWHDAMQAKFFTYIHVMDPLVKRMGARGSGAIVNVSSIATRGVNRVPYGAAKGGVNALTACLAFETAGRGIRVNATAPGGTEAPPRRVPRNTAEQTEQERRWYQQIVDQTLDSSLMKRYGTLDEQAAAILFLASDEASYITGVTLPVGGGDLG